MPFPALPSLPSAPAAGAAALHAYSQYTTTQANAWASGAKDMALPMMIFTYVTMGNGAMDTWVSTFMVIAAILAVLNLLQSDSPGDGPYPPPPPPGLAAAHEAVELHRLADHQAQSLQMLLGPEHRT